MYNLVSGNGPLNLFFFKWTHQTYTECEIFATDLLKDSVKKFIMVHLMFKLTLTDTTCKITQYEPVAFFFFFFKKRTSTEFK